MTFARARKLRRTEARFVILQLWRHIHWFASLHLFMQKSAECLFKRLVTAPITCFA